MNCGGGDFFSIFSTWANSEDATGFCGISPKMPLVHIGKLCLLHSPVGEVFVSQPFVGVIHTSGFIIMCPKMKHETRNKDLIKGAIYPTMSFIKPTNLLGFLLRLKIRLVEVHASMRYSIDFGDDLIQDIKSDHVKCRM